MPVRTVRSAGDAWRLLDGVLAVHKPQGRTPWAITEKLTTALAGDLSQMHLQREWKRVREEANQKIIKRSVV